MRVLLMILTQLLIPAAAFASPPSSTPAEIRSFLINPMEHECAIQQTSCGRTISDATDAYTCRTDSGYYFDLWQIYANAGDRITVTASSFQYQVLLVIFDSRDPSNPVIVANDVSSGAGQSVTINATAPGSGNYVISIGATSVAKTGPYSFTVSCQQGPAYSCTPTSTKACLLNGRFAATLVYRAAFDNGFPDTSAAVKPVSGFADPSYETAFFYFNSPNNIEVMLKMLDQGNTNGSGQPTIAVLFGTATPLRAQVAITDTKTGATKTYTSNFNEMKGTTDFTAFVK